MNNSLFTNKIITDKATTDPSPGTHHTAQAISLQYDGNTPIITANGEAELAAAMLTIATAHNIPIYENPALLNLLAQLEIGDAIPEALYLVVAHILAFVYQLQGKKPDD